MTPLSSTISFNGRIYKPRIRGLDMSHPTGASLCYWFRWDASWFIWILILLTMIRPSSQDILDSAVSWTLGNRRVPWSFLFCLSILPILWRIFKTIAHSLNNTWKFSQKTNHSFLFCFKFFRELWADVWSGGSLYFPKSIGGHIIYLMYSYIYLSEFVLKWIEFMAMFMVESNAAFAWEKSMKRFVNEDSWLHLRRDKRNHYYAKMSFWNTILPPYILTTHSTKSYPINITQLTSFAGEKMN